MYDIGCPKLDTVSDVIDDGSIDNGGLERIYVSQ
jgi:hypothetical protein